MGRQPVGALRNTVWIALGEYGRLELAPHSPVDVLLLVRSHAKHEVDAGLEAAARGVLSSLGFEIRLSVLTVKECLHRAQTQFPFAFACLGARRVSGDLAVFQEWNQRFWANLVKNQMAFLSELADYLAALHDDHGPSVYSTESDLNLGAGGLVDVAGLHGCWRLMTGSNDPLIRPVGSLAPRDWQRLERARRHLILVRNHFTLLRGDGRIASSANAFLRSLGLLPAQSNSLQLLQDSWCATLYAAADK